MAVKTPITVAYGDGIGPEIMSATLQILEAAGAALDIETIEIGEKVYLRGNIRRHRTEFLGISAPHQGLSQSAHHHAPGRRLQEPQRHHPQDARPVRQRPALRLLPSLRRHQAPRHGRRHRPRKRRGPLRRHRVPADARESPRCLKLISRPGSEKIVRYAFEYARRHNRKKVTCFTKDNIMKMTDGLFHKVFDEIGAEYPEIEKEALDRRYRRRQDGRHAGSLRRHRHAEPLRRHPLRRGRADRRLGRARRIRQHRRALRHVRSHPRLRAAPRRAESRQSLRPAARRDPDARPHRPARCRRARPQRLAAHHRRRHPHLRHLHRRREQAEGRHQGICLRRRRAPGPEAQPTEARRSTPTIPRRRPPPSPISPPARRPRWS